MSNIEPHTWNCIYYGSYVWHLYVAIYIRHKKVPTIYVNIASNSHAELFFRYVTHQCGPLGGLWGGTTCHTSSHSPWMDSSVSSPETPVCPTLPSSCPGCPRRLAGNSPAPPSPVCRFLHRWHFYCLRRCYWDCIYSILIKSLPPSAKSCCPGSLSTCPLRDPMVGWESSLPRLQPPTSLPQVRLNKTEKLNKEK